ncbi:MAG: hypothetical protein WA958_04430 [Tunicatimonas sp.]
MRKEPPIITAFEHQSLHWGDDAGGVLFTEAVGQALVQLHPYLPRPYYTLTHRGIKLSHYVGVLKTPYVTLEVLPKADAAAHPELGVWRQHLVDLVAACASLSVDHNAAAVPSFRASGLHEVYLLDFLTQLERLYRRGLTKQYQSVAENCFTVKGRLLFAEHTRRNVVHQERFFVEHATHTIDHPLHQLLKQALRWVERVSSDTAVQRRTRRLSYALAPVSDVPLERLKSLKLVFNRYTARYRTVATIAQQLLNASFSHVYRGSTHQGFAFMLDMNLLFEEFVYRRLRRLSTSHGFTVHRQATQLLWGATKARPDILIKFADGRENVVVDTKWKVLTQPRPSAVDLHQIYVYNQLFEARRGILLYPQVHDLPQQQHRFGGVSDTWAEVHFISIANRGEKGLNPQLDQFLLEMLTPTSS